MGKMEWYFFSFTDRKYPTGFRTNRATDAGYWKTTGKDKEILRRSGLLVRMTTLVFYKGRAPKGEKSNWVMHEYRLKNNHSIKPTKEEWVICRVFQKTNIVKKQHSVPSDEQSPDSPSHSNSILHDQFGVIDRMPNLSKDGTNVLPIGFPEKSLAAKLAFPNRRTRSHTVATVDIEHDRQFISPQGTSAEILPPAAIIFWQGVPLNPKHSGSSQPTI